MSITVCEGPRLKSADSRLLGYCPNDVPAPPGTPVGLNVRFAVISPKVRQALTLLAGVAAACLVAVPALEAGSSSMHLTPATS